MWSWHVQTRRRRSCWVPDNRKEHSLGRKSHIGDDGSSNGGGGVSTWFREINAARRQLREEGEAESSQEDRETVKVSLGGGGGA